MMHSSTPYCLVLMKGFPATGKSLLAQSVSCILHCPLIDKDDVKDHTLAFANANELAYDIMWSVTARQLRQGLSVVVDSPLTYPNQFSAGSALAATFGARLLVVETRLAEATWRERLEARDRSDSEHKVAGWNAMQELLVRYNGCWQYEIPQDQLIVVDAARPVDELTQTVLERLQCLGQTPARAS